MPKKPASTVSTERRKGATSQAARPAALWSVANAKAHLSTVLEKARTEGPQMITRNGKETAVVVGFEEWERRTRRQGSLAEFLYNSPWRGAEDIDLERSQETMREIDL